MADGDIYYSINGTDFNFDTLEEAYECEYHNNDYDPSDIIYIESGVAQSYTLSQYANVDCVLEEASQQAHSEMEEYADDYMYNVPEEAKKELADLMDAWESKHGLQCTGYSVHSVKEIRCKVIDEEKFKILES